MEKLTKTHLFFSLKNSRLYLRHAIGYLFNVIYKVQYMNTHKKHKIAVIGTVGVPANYGGFETLTEHLIEEMGNSWDITVYCSSKKYPANERKKQYKGAKLKYIPLEANGVQSVLYDSISIIHSLFFADILLILGVAGAWLLPFVRLFTRKKIIISIDGIEWKRDKWSLPAKWYLFWAESLAVKYSHIDISDNEAIQDYTAARYGTLSRIIEYGADHTLKVDKTSDMNNKYSFLNQDYAFKVCRIEPENNVHVILQVFSELRDKQLVIVGNWNNSEYGRALKEKYSHYSNLYLLDPIYDQKGLDVLRSNAALYVHGHSAGGTNPSLVEAMYLGLPIVAFGVSYNKVTTENKALYFNSARELKQQVQQTNKAQLHIIATDMGQIAHRRYRWSVIAQKYTILAREALIAETKPSVVPHTADVRYSSLLELGHAHLKTFNLF